MTQVLSRKIVLLAGEPIHYCPGCETTHRFNVNAPNPYTGARWTWDGNAEQPTFSPSMVVRIPWSKDEEPQPDEVCHYFLRNGKIEFLGDCTHALKGQTVDLPDLSDWYLQGGEG